MLIQRVCGILLITVVIINQQRLLPVAVHIQHSLPVQQIQHARGILLITVAIINQQQQAVARIRLNLLALLTLNVSGIRFTILATTVLLP